MKSIGFTGLRKKAKYSHLTDNINKMDNSWQKCILYMGQIIKEWTKLNLWKTAFKNFEWIWSA